MCMARCKVTHMKQQRYVFIPSRAVIRPITRLCIIDVMTTHASLCYGPYTLL